MKCFVCEFCEAARAALNKKLLAWLDAQANNAAIMEREADPTAVCQAHDLLRTDPVESFRLFLQLAEQGSVWGMASAGSMFETGTGTVQDLVQAEKWLVRAYNAGSDYGLIWLGHLYQSSKQYSKAQEVFRTGVARGFVPAMFRLAASYATTPNWSQRRKEALALLERASAAGDLSARRYLASGMSRGWFGVRRIPEGIRRLFNVFDEMTDLIEDEIGSARSERRTRPGFFSGLAARLWLMGATRHPAS